MSADDLLLPPSPPPAAPPGRRMTPRQRRLALYLLIAALLAIVVGLVLRAFNSNIVFSFTPTQIASGEAPVQRTFRLGGMVREGSVRREGIRVHFVVTDFARDVPVVFQGTLPDLFKEGKGVVTQGTLGPDGTFTAREVLAKHDENYMPPEAAVAMKKAGRQGGMPVNAAPPALPAQPTPEPAK